MGTVSSFSPRLNTSLKMVQFSIKLQNDPYTKFWISSNTYCASEKKTARDLHMARLISVEHVLETSLKTFKKTHLNRFTRLEATGHRHTNSKPNLSYPSICAGA